MQLRSLLTFYALQLEINISKTWISDRLDRHNAPIGGIAIFWRVLTFSRRHSRKLLAAAATRIAECKELAGALREIES